jgi:hypothetical protein
LALTWSCTRSISRSSTFIRELYAALADSAQAPPGTDHTAEPSVTAMRLAGPGVIG